MTESITSYIVNSTSDVSMVIKDKKETDDIDDKGGGKIIDMIKFLVQRLVANMK